MQFKFFDDKNKSLQLQKLMDMLRRVERTYLMGYGTKRCDAVAQDPSIIHKDTLSFTFHIIL